VLVSAKDLASDHQIRHAFFTDEPASPIWKGAWNAVDGGLVTFLIDAHTQDWKTLFEVKPDLAADLEKVDFVTVGIDFADDGKGGAVRARIPCSDAKEAADIADRLSHQADDWSKMTAFLKDLSDESRESFGRFFASLRIAPSDANETVQFVAVSADIPMSLEDLIRALTGSR